MPDATNLFRAFQNPPREYSPCPIWWWSGEKVEASRLRWQLERFKEGGVYQLVVMNLAPTGPLYGADQDDPPFLSEAWWTLFKGACKDAQELGMRLWFYDQIGFSGANFQGRVVAAHPEYAGESVECLTAEGDGSLKLECPAQGKVLARFEKKLGQGLRRARLVYSIRRGFDYFNPAACADLFSRVHGEFEKRVGNHFGKVIAGSFQDELPNVPSWGRTFAAEFKRRKGYDLVARLDSLWDGDSAQDLKVRRDYHACRAELQEEAFFKPLFQWHEKHGLLCGFDQQGDARSGNPVDCVATYADYQRTHRWFSAPGSDQHGETKIHSSLAHLYGRPRTWIESFHSSGWGGTLEETMDWLLPWVRAGANLYDPHAVYYSTRGGWFEWAPPSTCWRQPYWKHYKLFADAVARMCWLMNQGRHKAQVAVLFPNTTVQSWLTLKGPLEPAAQARDMYRELVGSMFFNGPIAGALDKDARDFDVMDDDSLRGARIEGGRLKVRDEEFSILLLPACRELEKSSVEAILRFLKSGGQVFAVGVRPEDPRLKKIPLVASAAELPAALRKSGREVEADVPTLWRQVEGADVLMVPSIYPRSTRIKEQDGWDPFHYNFDPKAYATSRTVKVKGPQGSPWLWDPFTGARSPLKSVKKGDWLEMEIPFSQGPAAWVVFDGAEPGPSLSGGKKERKSLELRGPWNSSLAPTMDNRFGDLAKPASTQSIPVQTWFFQHAAGTDSLQPPSTARGNWSEAQATFGAYGWHTHPRPMRWIPDPLQPGSDLGTGVRGWMKAEYSLSRGMVQDPLHDKTLGPKGHVPEEFLNFGWARAGQASQFRTSVSVPKEIRCHLAVGARALKSVWLNGVPLAENTRNYMGQWPVTLKAGKNLLEFRLQAEEDVFLRAHWAFVKDPAAYQRPEWIKSPDAPRRDSVLRFSTSLTLAATPTRAQLQVGADAPLCRLLVNGKEAGRQGGFDPYGTNFRVVPHQVSAFKKGKNEIVLEMQDHGQKAIGLMIDGLIEAGGKRVTLVSDASWKVQRDASKAVPALPSAIQAAFRNWQALYDPGWSHLWRRPHPLPGSQWLEQNPDTETVLPLVPDAYDGAVRIEWLRWTIPSGAYEATIPAQDGTMTLWVDGQEVAATKSSQGFKLPKPGAVRREALLRVQTDAGHTGGALLSGPVTYQMGPGRMETGSWTEQGLESYSGGLRYSTTFNLEKSAPDLKLDLGKVRGTAEVWVNGHAVGARFLSPYVFEVGKGCKAGENTLEILVLNTLAPYLRAQSPTRYITEGQTESGLFGPVRIVG